MSVTPRMMTISVGRVGEEGDPVSFLWAEATFQMDPSGLRNDPEKPPKNPFFPGFSASAPAAEAASRMPVTSKG